MDMQMDPIFVLARAVYVTAFWISIEELLSNLTIYLDHIAPNQIPIKDLFSIKWSWLFSPLSKMNF